MAERTLVGGVDTYVTQVSPGSSPSRRNYALVKNESGANARMLLWMKPPAPVEAGVTIISATLVLNVKFTNFTDMTFEAQPLGGDWKARKTTWNNQPSRSTEGFLGLPSIAVESELADDSKVEFDVTPHMQAVADGAEFYGWRIVTTSTNKLILLSTANAGAQFRRPRLIVEYANAPAPPTDLSPSGGFFVSVQKPVFRYSYLDFGGSRELIAHQIQIDPTEPEGTTFDTGQIPTSAPEYDPAGGSWAGLANGDAVRWRVRAQDGAGLWSPWSDWAAFERLNKGSLALTNPGPAPNNFVQSVKPPITWDHAGPWAQEAWQVIVHQRGLGGWMPIHNTGKQPGADDSYVLPKGILTRANWSSDPGGSDWLVQTDYRVTVRTWDGQGRQATPGDPAFYQARQEFTVREGATAKVTDLVAQQLAPWPFVELTWARDTAPHEFIIARDANIIEVVAPDEVDTGAGTYRFVDRTATLNREHTWAILPVVDNVMAPLESTFVRVTIESDGIWLIDPDRPQRNAVLIIGQDGQADVSTSTEDQAEDYEVIGRSDPVTVINAVGLKRGSVSGVVMEHPDLPNIDHLEWRSRLRDFKARPGTRLRLVMGDDNMPVRVKNVSDTSTPVRGVVGVSFEFSRADIPAWLD